MTGIAGVWDAGHSGENEAERVAADVDVSNGLLNLRHMAGHTLASAARGFVVRVLLDGRSARTVGRTRSVTLQAKHIRGLYEVGGIVSSMDIVTTEARHAASVHYASDKIIPLHSILVTRAIGKMGEGGFACFVVLQPPECLQVEAHAEPNRPVVVLPIRGAL
jgi:hypothetical protein